MLTRTGRYTTLTLPPDPPWPDLRAAAEEYQQLQHQRRATATLVTTLEQDRAKAVEGDRKRHAKAIREGKVDPGTPATDKLDRELANTRRRLEALDLAIAEAEGDVVAVVEAHQEQWRLEATQATAQASEHYRAAVPEAAVDEHGDSCPGEADIDVAADP